MAALVKAKGRKAALVQGDLADDDIAERLIAGATAQLGPLIALINNASIFEIDSVGGISLDSWQRHMNINLRAPVMLAQAFARQLPEGELGNIINIIDQRVWKLNPRFFSYTLSKSGLWTATRTLAQALAPRIRVNAIGPGPALPSVRMDAAEFAKQESLTLLGRGTSPRGTTTTAWSARSWPRSASPESSPPDPVERTRRNMPREQGRSFQPGGRGRSSRSGRYAPSTSANASRAAAENSTNLTTATPASSCAADQSRTAPTATRATSRTSQP